MPWVRWGQCKPIVGVVGRVGGWMVAVFLAAAPSMAAPPHAAAAPRGAPGDSLANYQRGDEVSQACATMLRRAQAQQRRLRSERGAAVASEPQRDAAPLLAALDDLQLTIEDTVGPLSLLAAVHPRASVRHAAEACERRAQQFLSALQQDAAIHARLQAARGGDAIDQRFLREQLDVFEDAGVELSAAQRASVRRLQQNLLAWGQTFERRLREDKTRLPFTAEELEGVPPAIWQGMPRDGRGRYRLDLDAPTVTPVLQLAHRGATRERIWRAYLNQGGDANLLTLARLRDGRAALAQRLGFASYADFVLRRRMAARADAVQALLDQVSGAVAERERADIAVLLARKRAHLGLDVGLDEGQAQMRLERWDVAYYTELIRQERYRVDQERFRRHFPPQASVAFVLRLSEQLLGLRFERLAEPAPWHRDTSVYAVSDAQDGRVLGQLYLDLYPRPDKYKHAAVWSFRNASTRLARRPAAALVVNFNRAGLNLDELETLLHEFGHAMHSLLSEARYGSQGGTNTALDFVEAPSQMLEDWVYDPRVLALFQAVCATCEPVPPEVLAQAERARHFGKGLAVARQHLFASYDLALYGPAGGRVSPMQLWQAMEAKTPLGHVPGSRFPAGFAHIAGSYAAGYYSYLWSLVIAEDLRTAFEADHLSASVGQRYRRMILAPGGQIDPKDMLREFLGREPGPDAFFKALRRQ